MFNRLKMFSSVLLLCLWISMSGVASGITISELRGIVGPDSKSVSRVRITSEVDLLDNRYVSSVPKKNNHENVKLKIKRINSRQKNLITYTADMTRNLIKKERVDLRDLDAIAKKENLSYIQKINLSRTLSFVVNNNSSNELILVGTEWAEDTPQAMLGERPGQLLPEVHLGTIGDKYLKEDYPTKLTEENSGYLRIEIVFDEKNDRKLEFICDPGLGYRFREKKWTYKGQVTKRITADDYKVVDGFPYPFTYTTTSYRDGKVIKQITNKAKKVELNPVLTEKDFKLFMPKGTFLLNELLHDHGRTIEHDEFLGINDVMGHDAKKIAYEELINLNARENISPTENLSTELFLPKMQLAKPKSKPFVLDLASRKLIKQEFAGKLNSEAAYKDFLKRKKGDILWSGEIVTVRDAEIISTKPDTLKTQKKKRTSFCEIALGCSLTIQTKEKRTYEIVVLKIYEDKIKILVKNKIN